MESTIGKHTSPMDPMGNATRNFPANERKIPCHALFHPVAVMEHVLVGGFNPFEKY